MQNPRAKTIRGLSIAVTIIAALSILGFLISAVIAGISGAAISEIDPKSLHLDPESTRELREMGIEPHDVTGAVGVLFGLGAAALGWGVLCSIVGLIAGILGIRNYDKVEKLGSVFGWSIAGAVTALLSCNIPICVLLIINAVCASKDRKAATTIPYGQPAAYTQAAAPNYYAAPQQPYYAPQQPYGAQPGQPYGAQPTQAPYYGQQPMQPQAQPQQFQPQQPAAEPQPATALPAEPQPADAQPEPTAEPKAAEPQIDQPQKTDEQDKQQ